MHIIPGNTKIEKYSYEGRDIFFKREDLNPSGSFKDRLIHHLWEELHRLPQRDIVLSSSGNLAISLLHFQEFSERKLDKNIKIFIKDNLPASKMSTLQKTLNRVGADLVISKRPKSDCFKYARENDAFWLRNSQGEKYPEAYRQLGTEILEYEQQTNTNFDGVFVCTSSATAAIGIMQEFLDNSRQLPVFMVQTSRVNSISKEFDQDFTREAKTLANAISDKVASRKSEAIQLAENIGGGGFVIQNEQISGTEQVLQILIPTKEFTGNAALSLAGFFKSLKKGYNLSKPLIIISGN